MPMVHVSTWCDYSADLDTWLRWCFRGCNITQCVIDECGMCTEPETLIPLISLKPQPEQVRVWHVRTSFLVICCKQIFGLSRTCRCLFVHTRDVWPCAGGADRWPQAAATDHHEPSRRRTGAGEVTVWALRHHGTDGAGCAGRAVQNGERVQTSKARQIVAVRCP